MDSWIILVLLALPLGWAVFAFNGLVRHRNLMRNAWADIDVQLSRRHDLVPQLVSAVKAYAAHEKAVLDSVTELRAQALQQQRPPRLFEVETALENALGRIFALQEAYPDLKASENFLKLQGQLVDIEDHLQYARRFYNGAVRDHNDAVLMFPTSLVARVFGFRAGEFYQAEDGARAAPRMES